MWYGNGKGDVRDENETNEKKAGTPMRQGLERVQRRLRGRIQRKTRILYPFQICLR